MGGERIRQGEQVETATRQAIDVNEANKVKANADTFDFRAMSFTGNSVANDSRFILAA